nr:peroxisomal sarcosine oxidase [Ciona intestinalis]XP_026693472.1 peroxisomal sarcosine oxidase [Ciona intestinalis]|eukprot:XP_009860715.1 peroxisomal sarcosine oxidase [Ciona intestinalis]
MKTDYDVIVIGGGVEGLSTARYLAKQSCRSLLLEQFLVPNNRGSSGGFSRTIRHSYNTLQHALMMPSSFKEWRELEKECNKKLLINTGVLSMCSNDNQKEIQANLKQIGIDYTFYKSEEIAKVFPGLNGGEYNAIYEREACIMKSDECLRCLRDSYISSGGTLLELQRVIAINPINEHRVEVRTPENVFVAESVVLTCGAWTNKMLKPLGLKLPLKVQKTDAFYWKTKDEKMFSASNGFPVSCVMKNDGNLCYSLSSFKYPGLVKVALHKGIEVDEDNRDAPLSQEQRQAWKKDFKELTTFVKEHYPGLEPVPSIHEACLYTMTPDEDFILDSHPSHRNIIIGAGFSGHGFKMGPVVGEILGSLALKRKPKVDTHSFLISRFSASSMDKIPQGKL